MQLRAYADARSWARANPEDRCSQSLHSPLLELSSAWAHVIDIVNQRTLEANLARDLTHLACIAAT